MKNLISAFTKHIIESVNICNNTKLKKNNKNISNIIICGMGGSAISGDLLRTLVYNELSIPIFIISNIFICLPFTVIIILSEIDFI